MGDRRAHENPALLSLSILFMRYHNLKADDLRQEDATLTDKELFALARSQVVADLQVGLEIFVLQHMPARKRSTKLDYHYNLACSLICH